MIYLCILKNVIILNPLTQLFSSFTAVHRQPDVPSTSLHDSFSTKRHIASWQTFLMELTLPTTPPQLKRAPKSKSLPSPFHQVVSSISLHADTAGKHIHPRRKHGEESRTNRMQLSGDEGGAQGLRERCSANASLPSRSLRLWRKRHQNPYRHRRILHPAHRRQHTHSHLASHQLCQAWGRPLRPLQWPWHPCPGRDQRARWHWLWRVHRPLRHESHYRYSIFLFSSSSFVFDELFFFICWEIW